MDGGPQTHQARPGASTAKLSLEQALWASRLVILPAAIFSIALATGIVYITTVDAVHVLGAMIRYASTPEHEATRLSLLRNIVRLIDGYLSAGVVVIFGLGLYELFVGKIGPIEGSEVASRLLLIRNLDDLKDRLAKAVMLALVIEFFDQALGLSYASAQDLLYLAIGIALLGVALYLVGLLGH